MRKGLITLLSITFFIGLAFFCGIWLTTSRFRIDWESYQKIENEIELSASRQRGPLTRQEVEAILGPAEVPPAELIFEHEGEYLWWRSDTTWITIRFNAEGHAVESNHTEIVQMTTHDGLFEKLGRWLGLR